MQVKVGGRRGRVESQVGKRMWVGERWRGGRESMVCLGVVGWWVRGVG